jgi:hypothetical protein
MDYIRALSRMVVVRKQTQQNCNALRIRTLREVSNLAGFSAFAQSRVAVEQATAQIGG